MKNYLIATALFLCLGFAGKAQINHCYIKLPFGVNACGMASLVYTNNTTLDLGLLCDGEHVFETGINQTAHIILNGTHCYPGEITPIEIDGIKMKVRQIATAEGPRYIAE